MKKQNLDENKSNTLDSLFHSHSLNEVHPMHFTARTPRFPPPPHPPPVSPSHHHRANIHEPNSSVSDIHYNQNGDQFENTAMMINRLPILNKNSTTHEQSINLMNPLEPNFPSPSNFSNSSEI
ncbi:hypothetical protein Smp_165250 [Schistosoma mansoni]|uniref:hypothetical protein n=1 Tax=Schistosoma mansoni TaxID=6183 RepID=UPI0001A62D19|nr:hypothetical protein Smp_165250 [Schistosoma mansoni]|eukprot:XP_018654566.1 hypothetical protein Smp_165250 [Schistosoma mansoni]